MNSPENFFSPSGGRGFGERLDGMTTAMLAVSSDFMDSFMLKPMYRDDLKRIGGQRSALMAQMYKHSNRGVVYPKRGGPPQQILGPHLADYRGAKSAAHSAARNMRSAAKQRYSTLRKGWRAASLGFWFVTAAEIGHAISSPGVSKIAAQNDQDAMMPTMLDSAGAFTQRQRAIAAIYDSQMTARNVIGNEARFMHR